jgi:hypothetical protein
MRLQDASLIGSFAAGTMRCREIKAPTITHGLDVEFRFAKSRSGKPVLSERCPKRNDLRKGREEDRK